MSILDNAKKISIPDKTEEKKIGKLAASLLDIIKSKASEHSEVNSIEFGGSYAKGTWLKGKLDLDIFVKIKPDVEESRFEEIGRKIGFSSLAKYSPYVRYSEHPYVEAKIGKTKINIVPCYDVEKGKWKSAADRSSFHTRFISENLDSSKKNEVRLLKKFLHGVGIYGAEIAKEGFSGYVAEVLIHHYGSFLKTLEAVSDFSLGYVIGKPAKKFDTAIVIIDPVDENRNLGTAISAQNVGKLILAAREYLKKPSMRFFTGKRSKANTKNIANTILVQFIYKDRSPDIIWGQVKRAATALAGQLELGGFHVLRKSALVDEKSQAAMLFLLYSPVIEKSVVKNGPEVFRRSESENFVLHNSKNKITWIDDTGRIRSLQHRDLNDARKFLYNIIRKDPAKAGIPSGIIPDIKRGFKVIEGQKATGKSIKEALAELTSTDEFIFGSGK